MKRISRNNWRKREFLFSLYCVAFLHYLIPASAAPSNRKQSPGNIVHSKNTRINYNNPSESNKKAQNQQTINPPISITKRSIQASGLPEDFHFLSQKDCEEDPSLCAGKFQTWDNQEYDNSNFPLDENDENMLVYSDMTKHYGKVAQNPNKIPDKYTLSQRTVPSNEFSLHIPKIIILALPKAITNDERKNESTEEGDPSIHESKKNIFTSRGWGAGGMPFSVLYLHQQQHQKPSRSSIVGAQQLVPAPAPLRGYPSQYRQVAVRNALSSALTATNNLGEGGAATSLPTRRQYSIIPQLYVSYGWGPHGK